MNAHHESEHPSQWHHSSGNMQLANHHLFTSVSAVSTQLFLLKNQLSKNLCYIPTDTSWLIWILVITYNHPHLTGGYNPPKKPKEQRVLKKCPLSLRKKAAPVVFCSKFYLFNWRFHRFSLGETTKTSIPSGLLGSFLFHHLLGQADPEVCNGNQFASTRKLIWWNSLGLLACNWDYVAYTFQLVTTGTL